jgi:hypothetical protein
MLTMRLANDPKCTPCTSPSFLLLFIIIIDFIIDFLVFLLLIAGAQHPGDYARALDTLEKRMAGVRTRQAVRRSRHRGAVGTVLVAGAAGVLLAGVYARYSYTKMRVWQLIRHGN